MAQSEWLRQYVWIASSIFIKPKNNLVEMRGRIWKRLVLKRMEDLGLYEKLRIKAFDWHNKFVRTKMRPKEETKIELQREICQIFSDLQVEICRISVRQMDGQPDRPTDGQTLL